MPMYQQVVILAAYYTASCDQYYSNILFVSKDPIKYEASHCKGDACSSQNGENDSEGKMY